MTYNVFGGTLSLNATNLQDIVCCVYSDSSAELICEVDGRDYQCFEVKIEADSSYCYH